MRSTSDHKETLFSIACHAAKIQCICGESVHALRQLSAAGRARLLACGDERHAAMVRPSLGGGT
eukprot:809181-Alexandrium_andersonii.AAC.1